jgi:flavin-dependent dehydrogenase
MDSFDAIVIGGGPAGATIARLLAHWGQSVVVLTRSAFARAPAAGRTLDEGCEDRIPSLAESLPPSIRKLFHHLGILDAVEAARFYPCRGNTLWWGDARGRSESFPGAAAGYQVQRKIFDRVLLRLAHSAGAVVRQNATVRHVDLTARDRAVVTYEAGDGVRVNAAGRFAIDCSGRAGVIARRGLRRKETAHSTTALVGIWRREGGWEDLQLGDPTHTLVESYRDGWAWSVPVSSTLRYVTAMVDLHDTQIKRGSGLGAAYHAELKKTSHLQKIVDAAELQSMVWSCDASLYSAERFSGEGFLLIGDAASFIDPLSSCGVKKALASAWVGAVVVNTCLRRPAMTQPALTFFDQRERRMYHSFLKRSGEYFQEAASRHQHAFWTGRSDGIDDDAPWMSLENTLTPEETLKHDVDVRAAFEALRTSPSIRLEIQPDVRIRRGASIEGREIVLRDFILFSSLDQGVRFVGGVDLPRLIEFIPHHSDVADLFEAYNRACPPVALPNFLGALSVLLGKGVMRNAASETAAGVSRPRSTTS